MTALSKDTLIINEIFFSIQGESTQIGLPCIFIRLTSCDLRCVWCDTAYAFEEGTEMTIDAILQKVKGYRCKLVEITGGEPLVQENVHTLIKRLCNDNYEVMIETGGHRDISIIDSRVKRIMDIKCPGSKMEKHNRWENIKALTVQDEVKFVIADQADYEWSRQVIQKHNLNTRCTVLMSPVFGKLENRTLAEWVLHDHLDVRFQLQIQKYIWDPKTRGV
jgi:7-carboxy-7-deazaguanine synthase